MKRTILFIMLLCLLGAFSARGEEIVTQYMIGDKEYKVEKIAGEDNSYWVFWGEGKMKWEPRAWMPDYLVERGPLYYDQWIQPNLIYPWDTPLEERAKWDANKIMNEWVSLQYGWPYAEDYCCSWPVGVEDPRGRMRLKFAFDWARSYFLPETEKYLPEDQRGMVRRKYMFSMVSPDDVKGMSGYNVTYTDPAKPDDVYFYLPSMRKVKRMSEGSRQDYMPGTLYRNEDFAIVKPIHNYKILRTELFEAPKDVYGFREKDWIEVHVPTIRHMASPCWVIEVTPKKTPWWFDKQILWIDMKTLTIALSLAYDVKGRIVRTNTRGDWVSHHEEYPLFITWQNWAVAEPLSGYRCLMFTGENDFETPYGTVNHYWNSGFPERLFSHATLKREPSTLRFWR